MSTAYVAVTIVTIALLVIVSIPDYVPAGFVLKNSAEVHVPRAWLPWLATLKLAGGAGLLVGLVGIGSDNHAYSVAATTTAAAAGVGLVLYFVGAVAFHARARVFYNIWFPAGYLLLSLASLVLVVTHASAV